MFAQKILTISSVKKGTYSCTNRYRMASGSTTDLICKLEQGELKGQVHKDMDGHPFLSFMGVPYAKPPVGDLRFKPPRPPEKWSGILDATKDGNVCYSVQNDITAPTKGPIPFGSEDCLFLNIFTRQLNTENLRPVMVFVHGGAFVSGSSSRITYGPEYLMTEDIVLVLMNYRLGVLGFLTIDDPSLEATGNAGLKDQVQALKWVQKNIKSFGGDPSNVTIFGQSAGSVSVHFLVLSPLTQGLFHKAIMQSGTVTCPWSRGRDTTQQIAQNCSCVNTNKTEMLNCLQHTSKETLLAAQTKILLETVGAGAKAPFGPTIEVENPQALINKEPVDLIKSGKYNHVPLMFGYTDLEGILSMMDTDAQLQAKLEDPVPYSFRYDHGSEDFSKLRKKINQFYFGNDQSDFRNKEVAFKLITDVTFVRGIVQSAKAHTTTSQQPVYLYRMSLDTDLNFLKKVLQFKSKGVCHGDDLFYLFKPQFVKFNPKSIEEKSIRRFVRLWTNFARSGDPTPQKDTLLKTHWAPMTDKEFHFLDIGEELVPGVDPDHARLRFWDDISKGINERY